MTYGCMILTHNVGYTDLDFRVRWECISRATHTRLPPAAQKFDPWTRKIGQNGSYFVSWCTTSAAPVVQFWWQCTYKTVPWWPKSVKQVRLTWLLISDQRSLAGPCEQDYKSLCAVVRLGCVSEKKGQDSRKKSQRHYISATWGEASNEPICTKMYTVVAIPDVITCAKFWTEIFRRYGFTGGRISYS